MSEALKEFSSLPYKTKSSLRYLVKHRYLYLLLLPTLVYFAIFKYAPMGGIILAFKDFNYNTGIFRSPWNGLDNISKIITKIHFQQAFYNTLIIAFYRLILEFPAPIFLALLMHELRGEKSRRFFQTVFTFPHFLSWIIIYGILLSLLEDAGPINGVLLALGLEKQSLFTTPETFRMFLVATNLWKEVGWGTIIYLATLAGIDPQLYEAVEIDGGNRFHKLIHITFPHILATVIIMLILYLGSVMSSGGGGFDQVFNLYNSAVYSTSDILDTYIYRRTFQRGLDFGTSTAVGLFKSLINFTLLLSVNIIVRKISKGEKGLF